MGTLTNDPTDLQLNDYEQRIYDYIKENEGLNGVEIVSFFDGKISKNVVNKYLESLENYHDCIENLQFSQGEKNYFIRKKEYPSTNQLNDEIKKDFEIRKSIVKKSLKYVQNKGLEEKKFVYNFAIKTIFSLYNFMKLLQAVNPDQKIKRWSDYEKESLYLLEDIVKSLDHQIMVSVFVDSDLEDLRKLKNYIKYIERKSLE